MKKNEFISDDDLFELLKDNDFLQKALDNLSFNDKLTLSLGLDVLKRSALDLIDSNQI